MGLEPVADFREDPAKREERNAAENVHYVEHDQLQVRKWAIRKS
jgi:hypothetical protein